jgi:pimeloyl-ACP methyl ester carboxylesterase
MRLTLSENAERLARFCRSITAARLHFVGHSLGGLIVLCMLESGRDLPPGRAVLLGSPVSGSLAARRLARLPGGRAALGRSAPEWHDTGHHGFGIRREIGVIAGRLPVGIGRIVAPDLPAPSDGVVSVAETRLPTMLDHIVLNVNHTGMLISRAVVRQVCAFLREGAFAHASDK